MPRYRKEIHVKNIIKRWEKLGLDKKNKDILENGLLKLDSNSLSVIGQELLRIKNKLYIYERKKIKKYNVFWSIDGTISVEARTKEEAKEKVRGMSINELFNKAKNLDFTFKKVGVE